MEEVARRGGREREGEEEHKPMCKKAAWSGRIPNTLKRRHFPAIEVAKLMLECWSATLHTLSYIVIVQTQAMGSYRVVEFNMCFRFLLSEADLLLDDIEVGSQYSNLFLGSRPFQWFNAGEPV